jgi:hypothetical protein
MAANSLFGCRWPPSSPRGFRRHPIRHGGRRTMLETVAIILIVLWLLGLVTSYTMGGLIHILVVIAIVVIVVRVIQRRSL